jgi:4-amino-4-deoxy-L-arabinose transferase-like glycosyltransferase
MTETNIREPVGHAASPVTPMEVDFPFATVRRWLNVGGCVMVTLNAILRATDTGGATWPVALWASAAVCFVASFIVHMTAPQGAHPDATVREESAGTPPAPETPDVPENGPASASDVPGETPRLLRPGNPLRLVRGGIPMTVASIAALVLMGREGQWRWGVPIGALLVAVACWGAMDLLGTFDDPADRVASSTTLRALARPLVVLTAAWVAFFVAMGLASSGSLLPPRAWGVVVTVAFVGAIASLFDAGLKLGVWQRVEEGLDRPLWKREGFWVIAVAAALYFPFMGTSALWDPWETHYGEVSREILARDDWISLWWAQDGWFWSKPVLDMWMQAIAMATLGVHYQPDKMLVGNGLLPIMHPEWAVRAPVVLVTILAMYVLYKAVVPAFGRRAAFLGSVVLATMPDWYFLAHQTMTDMPFVATMTASLGCVMLGLSAPEEVEARAYEVKMAGRSFRLTAWHLVFGTVLVCTLPQILYLISRNIEFLWRPGARGFNWHWDEFRSGSGLGNCGLPGNEDCHSTLPAFIPRSTGANPTGVGAAVWRTFGAVEPIVQAGLWTVGLGIALYLSWGERRVRRLYYLAGWFFAAVSTLGKGPAGCGIPILVTLAYLAASRPGEEFVARVVRVVREITQFEIVTGLLVILVVSMPWYVAMYVRHGAPFTDRLIFHDMFNRAFHHVHDTNEGDDTSFRFYVWQLGYALFPWTGLAPLGLLWWLRSGSTEADRGRSDAGVLLCLWFVFSFALFSFMGTKFHHYIFPAVPPVAMLIGLVLDDMLGDRPLAQRGTLALYLLGLLGGVTLLVVGVAWTQPGSFMGFKRPESPLAPGAPVLGAALFAGGAALIGAVAFLLRPLDESTVRRPDDAAGAHASRMLAGGSVAAGLLLVVVARDLIFRGESADQPGAIRLLQLFTYNYRRPWPESLDFSAALVGFSAIAILACSCLAVRAVRRHAVAALCVLGFVWGVWGLDVYMQRTAQHWGQHEVIEAYYADRKSPDEVLVAYQMNWKGENFYTGNHVPAFVSTGAPFTTWLKKQRDAGVKVLYFITEHGRIGGLKNEVAAKSYREVTDKTLCNKFVLVRAQL